MEDNKIKPSYEQLEQKVSDLETILEKQKEKKEVSYKRKKEGAKFLGSTFVKFIAGPKLYKNTQTLWEGWSSWFTGERSIEWPENATKNFAAALLARMLRIGIFSILVAVLPYFFIAFQTVILVKQNDLISTQNNLVMSQNQLAEASRRATLIFELSSILDRVDEEITKSYVRSSGFDLSDQLNGRIIALTRSLKPYQYLEGDTLTSRRLSPERGQLLSSLVASKVNLRAIAPRADFSYADLRNANLVKANLNRINMSYANLDELQSVEKTSFYGANLSNATFVNAQLREIFFSFSDMRNGNFSGATLNQSSLSNTDLSYSIFENTIADTVDFESSILKNVNFKNASLYRSNFTDADFKDAVLTNANLSGANFKNVKNFKEIKDIENANINGVKNLSADLKEWALSAGAVETDKE